MQYLLFILFLSPPEVLPLPAPVAAFPPIPVHDSPFGPVGGVVTLPPETHAVEAPVSVRNVSGLAVRGDGQRTAIVYAGPVGGSCLELSGTLGASVERTEFRSRLDYTTGRPTAEAGVVLTKRAGDVYAQKGFLLNDVWFGSHNVVPDFQHCVLIDSKKYGQPDGNNDQHEFRRARFRGYSDSAVKVVVGSTQVHALRFNGCDMEGEYRGKYGVKWDAKPFFYWHGGTGGHHTVCDFWLGDVGHKVLIQGWNSELTERLIDTPGPTGAYGTITVDSCRVDGIRAKDGAVIRAKLPGPWTITGNDFSSGTDAEVSIDLANNFAPVSATVTGNVVRHGRRPRGPFVKAPAGSTLVVHGNTHIYPGGSFID